MTKQIKDSLIFENETYKIDEYILESFFEQNPKLKKFNSSNTALLRGYVASFCVENEKLTIINIQVFDNNTMNLKLKSVFKDVFKNKTVCNWFSGFIRINEKNSFLNLKKEESTFIILEFHNGIYVGKRILNYIEFQSFNVAQFKKFKETENYKLVKENLIKTIGNEHQADTLIVNNILKLVNTTF